jgi:hypothetical protein
MRVSCSTPSESSPLRIRKKMTRDQLTRWESSRCSLKAQLEEDGFDARYKQDRARRGCRRAGGQGLADVGILVTPVEDGTARPCRRPSRRWRLAPRERPRSGGRYPAIHPTEVASGALGHLLGTGRLPPDRNDCRRVCALRHVRPAIILVVHCGRTRLLRKTHHRGPDCKPFVLKMNRLQRRLSPILHGALRAILGRIPSR